MRKFYVLFVCLICSCMFLQSCSSSDPIKSSSSSNTGNKSMVSSKANVLSSLESNAVTDISLTFVGDCTFGMINDYNYSNGFISLCEASNSPTYPFDRVKQYFENDDLTVINFEGTLTTATKEGDKQWHFKGPKDLAYILPKSSVEVAVLSNNHAPFDYLQQGLDDTKQALSDASVGLTYQNAPYVKTIKGIQVVIIGDSSIIGENTTSTSGVADKVLAQIKEYKTSNDIVVVDMHWGNELDTQPSEWQVTTAHQFIDAGADLVLGQHPHVVQGIEKYKGKYIAYSLGNFAFGGCYSTSNPQTFIFKADFSVSKQNVTSEINIIPCYMTSSNEYKSPNIIYNNFQPMPLVGKEADDVKNLVLQRSTLVTNGIKDVKIND